MIVHRLRGEFVDFIPGELEAGVLYISIPYVTTAHLCACGCGREVNLALDPTAYEITYDGRNVSLSPSVGNWSFECQSHYWIREGEVRWSGQWSQLRIATGRQRTLDERGVATAEHHSGGRRTTWWSAVRQRWS